MRSPPRSDRQRKARKVRLPKWVDGRIRPVVREAAHRGGLASVESMVLVEGLKGQACVVLAVPAGGLAEFYRDPRPALAVMLGGSALFIFESADDGREVHRELEEAWQIGQQLRLAMAPAEGHA
jgi:hypothetical protein